MGSTLTADDYQFYEVSQSHGYIYTLTHASDLISGRYSYAFVVVTAIKLLGLKAVSVLPIVSLILLLIGAIYASMNILKIMKRDAPRNTRSMAQIAAFTVVGSLITAPSIFDTFVWFSATPAYVLSLAVLLIAVSLALGDIMKTSVRWWLVTLVFLLCLFAAGFIETVPIALVILGTIGLATGLATKSILTKKLYLYSGVLLVAGCIGGILLRLSSWTNLRISSGLQLSTDERIGIAIGHLQLIPQYIFSWRILFSIAFGLLLFMLVGKVVLARSRILICSLSVGLIFLPCLIIGALAAASGLIEATNLGSNRLLYDGTTGIMIGLGLLFYIICSLILPVRLRTRYDIIGSVAVTLALLLCVAFGTSSLNKVAQAVYVKKSMLQYRESVIHSDLANNRPSVRILSAPILLKDSQINDIGFGSPKEQVWAIPLRGYYHIPRTTPLEFSTEAPAGYCTFYSDSATYGKQTCDQIVNHADSLHYTTYP